MRHPGVLTISIDLELAWGCCDVPLTKAQRRALEREREVVGRLLRLFSQYEIRATWAVVGHLLCERCEWRDGLVHGEIPRPAVLGATRDWFFQHPTPGASDEPLWYGRDLIDTIRTAQPAQELGSHSFAHLPYDERRSSSAAVRADLAAARRAHERAGLAFETFVFPRNVVGYRALLAEAGVRRYRGVTRRWFDAIPSVAARRLLRLAASVVPMPPPTVQPRVDEHGLLNIPDSMLLMSRNGLRRLISSQSLIRKGTAGLDRAAARGEVFHLWFHASNFAARTDEQFRVLETLLRHADALRTQGGLEVRTMGDHTASAGRGGPDDALEVIRERAVTVHDEGAQMFARLYDAMAQDPFGSAFAYGRQQVEECLRERLHALGSGGRVLDVGCGTGDQIRLLRQRGVAVSGVEPSGRMRAIAQTRNPGADIRDGDIRRLPFRDATFDAVLAVEVLRYLGPADIDAACREVFRVLKPGGQFFFTMVNRYALDGFFLFDRLRRALTPTARRRQLAHCEFVTPAQVERRLRGLGVRELTICGRVILPLRLVYKVSEPAGGSVARALDGFDRWLARRRWTAPLAGHLIVTAVRPPEAADQRRAVDQPVEAVVTLG